MGENDQQQMEIPPGSLYRGQKSINNDLGKKRENPSQTHDNKYYHTKELTATKG